MSHRQLQIGLALFMLVFATLLPDWQTRVGIGVAWLLAYLPWILLGAAAITAYIYDLKKFSLMVVLCLAVYAIFRNHLMVMEPGSTDQLLFWEVCLLAPLLIYLYDQLPDHWLFDGYFLAIPLALAPCGLLLLAHQYFPELERQALEAVVGGLGGDPAPWVALLLILLYCALCALTQYRNQDKGDSAALVCLVALALLFANHEIHGFAPLVFTYLGLALWILLLFHGFQVVYFDPLTEIRNRRRLDAMLRGRGGRYQLAMVDVDHFKRFNDTFGHDVGDEVLRMVAQRLSRVGAGGVVFRYGGEEFTILFPSADRSSCLAALAEVRMAIAAYPFRIRARESRGRIGRLTPGGSDLPPQTITVSIGLAQAAPSDGGPEEVIRRADTALYQAKEEGRNCIRTDTKAGRGIRRKVA
ncbi:GGDEF domain-containing protein [Ferrimonas sediminicola]|nr:GGDEF domain-containing protein [Ferrimonas sediminicola]